MKGKIVLPVVLMGGLVLGLLIGRQFLVRDTRTDSSAERIAEAKRSDRQRHGEGGVREAKHDYKTLLKAYERRSWPGAGPGAEMERLSVTELKGLLEEAAAKLAEAGSDPDIDKIIAAAGAELFNREGESAVRWAADRPLSDERKTIVSAVMDAAASKSPVAAKPWIDELRVDYGSLWGQDLIRLSLEGSASRSADEMVEVLKLYQGESSNLFYSFGPFADDFDFHRLVTEMPALDGTRSAFKTWAAKDRDAAWAGMVELVDHGEREGPWFARRLLEGISGIEGLEKAGEWIFGKLDGLPAAQRAQVVENLNYGGMSLQQTLSLMKALPSDTDRITYSAVFVGPYGKNTDAVLDALPQELRADVISRSAEGYPRRAAKEEISEAGIQKAIGHYDRTMEKYGVPADVRERVRKGLENSVP